MVAWIAGWVLGVAAAALPAAPDLTDKTLVAWVAPANLTQRGGSALTLQSGSRFDAIVLGEIAPGRWIAGSENFARTRTNPADTPTETAAPGELIQMAITYRGPEITLYRNGKPISRYAVAAPAIFGRDRSVVIGLRHRGASPAACFAGQIADARIYAGALSPAQIAALRPGRPSTPRPLAWWNFAAGLQDRMGAFRETWLTGGAKLAHGRLQLDGKDGSLMALNESDHVDQIRYRPRVGLVGDAIPFYWKGKHHLFYLNENRWDHIVTTDLVHWTELPPALSPGADPAGPDGEACWTGSIVERSGLFHLFYTGKNSRHPAGDQKVMVATSPDLIHWTKDPARTFYADGRIYWSSPVNGPADGIIYHHQAFRDPDVFWNARAGEWWLLIHALCADRVTPCLGLFASPDLRHWTAQEPLARYPAGVSLDCPHAAPIGDRWFVIAAERHYAAAPGPEGPYPAGMIPFESGDLFVPKTLFDGVRRLLWGWVGDLEGRDDAGPGRWGGTLSMAREIYADADGHLRSRPPSEIVRHFRRAALTAVGEGPWEAPVDCMIEATLRVPAQGSAALTLRALAGAPDSGYRLSVDAGKGEVALASSYRRLAQPWRPAANGVVKVTAFVLQDIIECFVDDALAFTLRAYQREGHQLSLELSGGAALRSLRAKTP